MKKTEGNAVTIPAHRERGEEEDSEKKSRHESPLPKEYIWRGRSIDVRVTPTI